jgi:mannose-6-phosphate isomerase-like protein (cupin superfamily)
MCDGCQDKPVVPAALSWAAGAGSLSLLRGAPQTCGIRCGRVDLESGANVGSHNTHGYEEILVILEGAGVAELAGASPTNLQAGQVFYVPPHTQHNIRNEGSARLRYLYIVAPAAGHGRAASA